MGWETQRRRQDSRAVRSRFGPADAAFWLPVGFLIFLGLGALFQRLPWAIPAGYAVASLISAAAYAQDKARARAGRWRTPETALHLLDVFGGWPGGLLAQRIVRHKDRKLSFQIVFGLGAFFHLAFWAWVFFRVPAEDDFWAFIGKVFAACARTVGAFLFASCFAQTAV